jgi:hypothetical protein
VFTSEPEPVTDRRPQIVVVLLEEARRPVGVTSANEWVIVPPMEQNGGWLWHVGNIGIHGVEDIHQFCLDFGVGQRFDTLRPVTLSDYA